MIDLVKQENLNPNLTIFNKEIFDKLNDLVVDQKQKLAQYRDFQGDEDNRGSNKSFRFIIYKT
jgi:hypothetical protein